MTTTEAERIMTETIARYQEPTFEPDTEFTAQMLAARMGEDKEMVRRRLDRDVAAGLLSSRMAKVNNRWCRVYRAAVQAT